MGAAILAEGLEKSYGRTRALAGLDLEVPEGTVLGVLGPNGAGKTTAVRVLATLLRPDAAEPRSPGSMSCATRTRCAASSGCRDSTPRSTSG